MSKSGRKIRVEANMINIMIDLTPSHENLEKSTVALISRLLWFIEHAICGPRLRSDKGVMYAFPTTLSYDMAIKL